MKLIALLFAIILTTGCSSMGSWQEFRDGVNANPVGDWLFPDNVTERTLSAYEDGFENLSDLVDDNLAALSDDQALRYAELKLEVARALEGYTAAKADRDLGAVLDSGDRIRSGLGGIGQIILDAALAKAADLVGMF